VVPGSENYHTLLSERFDRTPEGKRIHFASAMTMLGRSDGDNHTNGFGYLDIVDFILRGCTRVDDNLRELYRRVAFNICIGNTDDHFRNHGFLLVAKGWTLSPAYDINPTLNEYQSLLISSASNESSLEVLLEACGEYMLDRKQGSAIIQEVVAAVKNWKALAGKLQVPKPEMDKFSARFAKHINY
jgi:serine/threonine-protein kinase HipA